VAHKADDGLPKAIRVVAEVNLFAVAGARAIAPIDAGWGTAESMNTSALGAARHGRVRRPSVAMLSWDRM